MKKLSVVLMTIFTLFLAGVLTACGKSIEVKFNQNEFLLSIGETLNLDDCITIKNGKNKDITFKCSDSLLFDLSENSITAKKSGRGTIYAYKGANNLAHVQVVVREKFAAPTNFNVDANGILNSADNMLTWDAVSGNFEGQTVVASQYKVEGTLNDDKAISQIVNSPSFQFEEEGIYDLKISVLSTGYFSDSDESEIVVFYNFVAPATNLTWQNGLLSWKAEENVSYSVRVDGTPMEIDGEKEKFEDISSKDLTAKFKSLSAGEHVLTVVAHDKGGTKRDMPSQDLEIVKLKTPIIAISEGQVEITSDDANDGDFKIVIDGQPSVAYDLNHKNLLGLAAGEHKIQAYAAKASGLFFESDLTAAVSVYKLGKLNVTYLGGDLNGNVIKANISGTAPCETKFVLSGVTEDFDDGFSAGEQNKENVEIPISQIGGHTISIYQKSVSEKFGDAFVLNGDSSDEAKITKVGNFANVTHRYEQKKSVITFDKVDFAKKYQLQSSSKHLLKELVPTGDESTLSITLDGRLEDLIEDGKIYVVAFGDDAQTSIGSSFEKSFTVLGDIQVNGRENTDNTISWSSVENAAEYELNVQKFESEEASQGQEDGTEVFNETTAETSYTFESEGYYRVTIKALPQNDGAYLGSKIKTVSLIVAVQTEIDSVEFRYDDSLKDDAKSGYYITLKANDKISGYQVTGSGFEIQESEATYYLGKITRNLNSITIKTQTIDEKIYLPTEYTLYVNKLPDVATFTIDDSENSLNVEKNTNATKVAISCNSPMGRTENGNYTLPTVNDQFTLEMQQIGTARSEEGSEKVVYKYEIEGDTVYLDSDVKSYTFRRISQPTNLQYNSADKTLTLQCDEISQLSYLVLDIFGKIGGSLQKLSVRFDSSANVNYQGVSSTLSGDFVSQLGKTATIKLGDVLALLRDSNSVNEKIVDFYANSTELSFSVYAYKALNSVAENPIIISSNYATLQSDAGKQMLTIAKMTAQKLSFDRNELKLTWQAMSSDVSVAADAEYKVYCEGVWDEPKTTSTNFLTLSEVGDFSFEEGKEYVFYIVATHANYLESANSNYVRVKKLNKIAFVTLTENTLTFANSNDESSVEKVEVTINANEPTDATNGSVTITEIGTYKLKVVAVADGENDYYYLDSSETKWTLKKLDTLAVEPLSIELNENELSWTKFPITQSLTGNLEYLLSFSDSTNTYICKNFKTSEAADNKVVVDISADENILAELSKLNAGEITVGIYAHLTAYSVAADGEIYYSDNIAGVGYNYYAYSQEEPAKMNKYEKPVLGSLEFVYENRSEQETYLQDANKPKIKITFKGEYGEGKFKIVVGNQAIESVEVTHSAKPEDLDEYTFTLENSQYENAAMFGSFKILIYALNNDSSKLYLPSSACEIQIVKAERFKDIQFANTTEGYLEDTLKFTYSQDAAQALNGIVLKIEYYKDGEEQHKTKYLLVEQSGVINENIISASLKEFISQNMTEGGHIKITAFVNSYSNNSDIFILAGDEFESAEFDVLKSVESIVKQSGGFKIETPEENAVYEVVVTTQGAGGSVILTSTNDYTFTFPDQWDNGEYQIYIVAKAPNKVKSALKAFTLKLTRMPSVTEVKMKRGTDNQITIYWDPVDNADGYILNMYLYEGYESDYWDSGSGGNLDVFLHGGSQKDNKGKLVYVFNTKDTEKPTGTSFTLEEIFGDAYSKLIEYGILNNGLTSIELQNNVNVVFGLVCNCKDEQLEGTECKQNSKEFIFNATIKGNGLTAMDFVVDDYGVVYFEGDANETYLYRIINFTGASPLSEWKKVQGSSKVKIDTSAISGGISFNIEVITMGSATTEEVTSSNVFSLDSVACTTFGSGSTFNKINDFTRISQDQTNPQNLKFEFTSGGAVTVNILVGTNERAIFDEKVVSFVLGSDLTYDLPKIVNMIKNANYTFTDHLYFWMYWKSEESSRQFIRVVSSCKDFDVKFSQEELDYEIVKLNENTGVENIKSDYVNTFAKFTNSDDEDGVGTGIETLGIYVKFTQISGYVLEATESMKFVEKATLLENDYFDNKTFAVNITELFEEVDLAYLTGEFKIEFCKIFTDNNVYSMTQWFEVPTLFTRLDAVSSLRLDSGNLIWVGNSTKYQIDFYYGDDITMGEDEAFDYSQLRYCQSFIREEALFNASDFANEDSRYFLSVRSVDTSEYNISSRRLFVGRDDSPTFIYKNKITQPLALDEHGRLFIDWPTGESESDFIKSLKIQGGTSDTELANKFFNQVFTSPFTFTVASLANDNVVFKFQFMKDGGFSYEANIKASLLLEDIFSKSIDGLNIRSRLAAYQNAASSTTDRELIPKLIEIFEKSGHGIGNDKLLFDDMFDKVQAGQYSLRYCLLGNNNMLTSSWVNYTNINKAPEIYVNPEPNVTVISKQDVEDKAMTTFQLIIHKSQVYNQSGDLEEAQNYKMVLGNHVFMVQTATRTVQLENADGNTVTLYYCDVNGNIASDQENPTDYVTFYINHNNGDSLLGVYNDKIQRTDYTMQVYAVGNNFSISSKSEMFRFTFLQIPDLKVRDGEFVWSPQRSRATTVYAQHENSLLPDEFPPVSGEYAEATFSLEGKREGKWSIRFVVKGGEIKTNNIYIDSDIYEVEAYKLIAPRMQPYLGRIKIENPSANITALDNTTANLDALNKVYEFRIFNNIVGATNTLRRTTGTSSYIYEVGTTGMDSEHSEYPIKNEDKNATVFNAISVGGTTNLVADEEGQTNKEKYYIKSLKAPTGQVVLSSSSAELSASMLDSVTGDSLKISQGVVTWDAVEKRSKILDVPEKPAQNIVYKVTVQKYTSSILDSLTSQTVQATKVYYTEQTRFDFISTEKDSAILPDDPGTSLRITVQAMSINVIEGEGYGVDPEYILVEGGKYIDVTSKNTYQDLNEYVLMSQGTTIDDIERVDSVIDDGTFEVRDGKLRWTYSAEGIADDVSEFDEAQFNESIGFEVYDTKGNLLSSFSDFEVVKDEESNLFKVTYNDKNLPSGTYSVKVYAVSKLNEKLIKSYPVVKEITKLEKVAEDFYSIEVDAEGGEWLTFEEYFKTHNDDIITATVNEKAYVFSKDGKQKYAISDTEDSDEFILLGNESVDITFVVSQEVKAVLYSDESTIKFSRSKWADSDEIKWDEVEQKFTWDYTGEGAENEDITYFVEIAYGQNKRNYTTKDKFFRPTVIGSITSFRVRAKVNNSSALSVFLEYTMPEENIIFNLFAAGDGTQNNPYLIENQTQFENIKYRLTKDEALNSYYIVDNEQKEQKESESIFYFKLNVENLEITTQGVAITGDFGGHFDGDGKTITFNSTNVGNIRSVSVTNSNITVGGTTTAASYTQGSALFENVLTGAYVRNFNLQLTFGKTDTLTTSFSRHILVAGVAITNSGFVQNINITKFTSNLSGRVTSGIATSAYAGVVAINQNGGEVSSCNLQTSIVLNDNNNQQNIFLAGIVYTNYGSIVGCTAGRVAGDYAGRDKLTVNVGANASGVQIAGIVVTSIATLQNCTNECVISATASGDEQIAYVAGICARLRSSSGSYTGNNNNLPEYNDMTGNSKQNPNAEGFSDSHVESVYITY